MSGDFLEEPSAKRFRCVYSRDDTGARFDIYEDAARGDLLAKLRPNQGAITTLSQGDALVRELERLRPVEDGPYVLLFWPEMRLRPTPEVRRVWANYLKNANVERLCLLNYRNLGAPYKVVAQLIIGAAGMRNARFFESLDEALTWAHGGATSGDPVYPYAEEGVERERGKARG